MLHLILMLLGLAFSNNHGNTTCNNHQNPVVQNDPGSGENPGGDIGDDGDTGGNTGQLPPPFIHP